MSRLMARLEKVFGVWALVLLAVTATAQTRPDFSGRWTVVPEPPAAGGGRGGSPPSGTMGSGWGGEITITQTAATLTVERAQFSQYDMQPPLRFTYALDGSESRNTFDMGRGAQEMASKAMWREPSLVISTSYSFNNPQNGKAETIDVQQELSLDATGSLVITTTRILQPAGPPPTTTSTTTKYVKG
jgi:arylsulfatase